MKKEVLVSGAIGALVFLPLFLFLLTPQAKLRFAEVNIFSDGAIVARANQQIDNDGNALWSQVLHNRRVGYTIEYLRHYFDNISPRFLFIKGDGNPKFSIQDVGQLYIFEIPFFALGILYLFRKREGRWWIVPFWLLIGIIPAGTARETPHALRIEASLPTFQILVALGIHNSYKIVSSIRYKVLSIAAGRILAISLAILATINIAYFLHNYFVHYRTKYSSEWQYGYKESLAFTSENEDKYEKIIFTTDLGRPYIYALFHKKYDPKKFREEAKVDREALGFVHIKSFGKYEFVKSIIDNTDTSKHYLYVDKTYRIPQEAVILASFKELDENSTLSAYEL